MFGRRKSKHDSAHRSGSEESAAYVGLRNLILALDPSSAGLVPTREHPRVWGALMETGYPEATVTVVALADGTTSLYTSSGFGIIGGGGHAPVVEATRHFLLVVESSLDDFFMADPDDALPAAGQVTLRALTFEGRRSAQATEDDLGKGRHSLSGVFHSGQRVLTELRLVHEARSQQ